MIDVPMLKDGSTQSILTKATYSLTDAVLSNFADLSNTYFPGKIL